MLAVVMVEVLGFSSMTLVPVFARDVFGAGPDAYGIDERRPVAWAACWVCWSSSGWACA